MPIDLSNKQPYVPTAEEAQDILDTYTDFLYDRNLKTQAQDILGGMTLLEFWTQSEIDYNVIAESQDSNDPIVPYASGVSRDKADIFITNLALNLFYPTVNAQNANQEIDRVMSRVSRSLLEYAHENDGRPAESGHSKFVKYVHKDVVQGTVHVQDDIVDGKLCSSLVPNEEIYVPNFYQPNIQLQEHVFRVQDNITYRDAELQLGELENFQKYVYPGMGTIFMPESRNADFQKIHQIMNPMEKCQIVRKWRVVPPQKLREYKMSGRLPSHVKRAKYFNIYCNGVPMFAPDNLMPYWDGYYPITKGIFAMFSKPEYYWGNSLPNKIKHDKKFRDGWKTLLRWRGKLNAIPPIVTFNGTFVDSDVFVPGMATQAPAGMTKDDVQVVPGVTGGIDQSDILIMNQTDSEIDRATTPPTESGQATGGRKTAREMVLVDANAKKVLNGFALQTMFFTSARALPILHRMFQFVPRQDLKKIAIPNQALPGGKTGSMEVIFMPPTEMTAEEYDDLQHRLYRAEMISSRRGQNKKINIINTEYLKELDFYVKASAEEFIPDNPTIRQAKADMKFQRYSSRPDLFNARSAARLLVNENGDNEDEMLTTDQEQQTAEQQMMEQGMQGGQQGMGSGSNQNPMRKMGEQGNVTLANNKDNLPSI